MVPGESTRVDRVRSGLIATLAAAGVCGVLVLLALVGAGSRPGVVFHGDSYRHTHAVVSPTAPTAPPPTTAPKPPPPHRPHSSPIVFLILMTIALGAVILAGFGAWMWWTALASAFTWRRRRRISSWEADEGVDVVADASRAVAAEEPRLRSLLADGRPRNAIVACWHHLEDVAAGAGLRRQDWETSSEFVIRILDTVGADHGATLRLAVLFREARYSEHAMSEADRADASACLDEVLAGLKGVHR